MWWIISLGTCWYTWYCVDISAWTCSVDTIPTHMCTCNRSLRLKHQDSQHVLMFFSATNHSTPRCGFNQIHWSHMESASGWDLVSKPMWFKCSKTNWLVVEQTPLKNISQLGWLFPIYGKNKTCSKPPTSKCIIQEAKMKLHQEQFHKRSNCRWNWASKTWAEVVIFPKESWLLDCDKTNQPNF